MSQVLVVGEDSLCCALGEKLVKVALPRWRLAGPLVNTKGVTKLVASMWRYAEQARYVQPVLCIADTDGQCAVDLLHTWLPPGDVSSFLLRLAVTEAESWVLADRSGFASTFQIPANKLPTAPDDVADPKRLLLSVMAKSKKRVFRDEMIAQTDASKPGSGYNLHLCDFVRSRWDVEQARAFSPSLNRAYARIQRLAV